MSYVEFNFNTALSGVEPTNGAWEKEKHDTMAKQIRGRIMSQSSGDGISGMRIERYELRVDYEPAVITREQVIEAVQAGIAWSVENVEGAFPQRVDKTPEATLYTYPVKTPTGQTKVIAKLASDLYACPATDEQRQVVNEQIATDLLQFDGVRSFGIYINRIALTISDKVATKEIAKKHIEDLLNGYAQDPTSQFLPFAKGKPVEIKWNIYEIMQ